MNISDRNNLPVKQITLIVTGTNWTTDKAFGVVYQTVDGTWRMAFNIDGGSTSVTSLDISVEGVTFDDAIDQCVACRTANGARNVGASFTNAGTGTIRIIGAVGVDLSGSLLSADVALKSKPSFVE